MLVFDQVSSMKTRRSGTTRAWNRFHAARRACDLAVASEAATFALPGATVGVFCSTPAVGVARNIGRKRVMELLLTGQPIDARTAQAWGLINRVVPAEALDASCADSLLSLIHI